MPIGYAYAPGTEIALDNGAGGSAPSRLSPQQAVKILSLRVPDALPSNAPVARDLLTSQGGAAPGANALQSMVQQLIGGGTLPSKPFPMPPTQAPTTGGNQNASQQGPEFIGNYDVPTPGYQHPLFNGGQQQNASNDFAQRQQMIQQMLTQFGGSSAPIKPRLIVGNPTVQTTNMQT